MGYYHITEQGQKALLEVEQALTLLDRNGVDILTILNDPNTNPIIDLKIIREEMEGSFFTKEEYEDNREVNTRTETSLEEFIDLGLLE